jgi:protein-S-isoprenylcysteine O-methyltransferase Ste14
MLSSSLPVSAGVEQVNFRRALDLLEKAILLVFYALFLIPIAKAVWSRGDVAAGLLGASETLALILVLFRKPALGLTQHPVDWLLAFGATLAPLFMRPVTSNLGWVANVAILLMVSGICFQIYAKYILGRRFGVVAANRGICNHGPYHLVRHPIYLGYLINHICFVIASFSFWNLSIFVLTYLLMIPRIFAEERLLRRDSQYEAYCHQVRFRLIPGLF